MRRTTSFLVAIAVVTPASLAAQSSDTTSLTRVVVTATRTTSTIGTGVATTHVLNGTELRNAGVRDVAEALRFVPGISFARSGGPGAQSSLFLRGGENDYVRVLVDGVAINNPGGAIDFASLTLDDVERIEVVRGPSSVLYGSDAVTGVIQIFTRRGYSGRQIEAAAGGGSYGAQTGSISLGAGGSTWNAAAGYAHRRGDGILDFNNDYRNDVVNGRFDLRPSTGSLVSLNLRQFDDEYHYPTDGAGNVVDRNAFRADRRTSMALNAEQQLGDWGRVVVLASALEARGRSDDAQDDASDVSGVYAYQSTGSVRRRSADARVELHAIPRSIVTAGGEWSQEAQRSRDSSNFDFAYNSFAAQRITRAAYAQWVASLGTVQLVAGGRYDDNDVFGIFRTGRLGAAMELWNGASLRGSVANAFKSPTFLEQFNTAFTVGNSDLTPERSRSLELGWTQGLASGRAEVGVTWFEQRFRDLIQYTFISADQPNYFNIARASSRGAEVEGRLRASIYHFSAAATYVATRVQDSGFDQGDGATFVLGKRLLRRPTRIYTLGAGARPNTWLQGDVTIQHIGDREDLDFSGFPATPVKLDPYTRVDAAAQIRLWERAGSADAIHLLLRADNLLDEKYEELHGFAAPGRSVFVGLRIGSSR